MNLRFPWSLRFGRRDLFRAWLMSTLFSGLPSTLYAFASGGDLLEATRAAGAMLLPRASDTATLVAAATVIHPAVSRPQFADHLMWGALLGATLEYRQRGVERRNAGN